MKTLKEVIGWAEDFTDNDIAVRAYWDVEDHEGVSRFTVKIFVFCGEWRQGWVFKPEAVESAFPECLEHFKKQMIAKGVLSDTRLI